MSGDYKYYFVDESGDLTFFRKGKPANLPCEDVSSFFMLGAIQLKDNLDIVTKAFEELRNDLVNDPFLGKFRSIKRTAQYFHACNDHPAIRREVFKLLKTTNVSAHAIVMRKRVRLHDIKTLYKVRNKKTKIDTVTIYGDLTSKLFKNLLHTKPDSKIIFAHRGKETKDDALRDSIERAKIHYYNTHNIAIERNIEVSASEPSKHIGLQIADYYLWALHQLYEKGDDSYYNLLQEDYSFVMDIDDQRSNSYGVLYNHSNLLTLERIKGAS